MGSVDEACTIVHNAYMDQHHALLLYAPTIEASALPLEYTSQSIDVQHIIRDRFSIDDARELSRAASSLPVERTKRIFVIVAHTIAVEAQNALLKLFEEPPVRVQFYVIVPKTATLLATLRSRLFEMSEEKVTVETSIFEDVKRMTPGDRLSLIAEKTKTKDPAWIEMFLTGAEAEAHLNPKLLRAVVQARAAIGFRGSSAKMLLEEVALCLP